MGVKSRVSMAYVACCVTLTCTAAAMTTANLNSHSHQTTPAYETFSAPFAAPHVTETIPQRNRFFARAYRFHRNNNRLANGGLSV